MSPQAQSCPHCGAPDPKQDRWQGWGYAYRSPYTLAGWPLLHISFQYQSDRKPIPACGVIAIGQFACGIVCIGQFTFGLITLSQFTIAGLSIAQFALGYSVLAQYGVYIHEGYGMIMVKLVTLLSP